MNTTEILERMFAVHGKRPYEAQFSEYLKVFDNIGSENSLKVFRHVRDNEDRFPTIKQMRGIISGLGIWETSVGSLREYEDCYYCQGVGYVPYLLSPKKVKKIVKYETTMMACNCKAGQDLPENVQRYFSNGGKVQFQDNKEGLSYPMLVSLKQIEFNGILREIGE